MEGILIALITCGQYRPLANARGEREVRGGGGGVFGQVMWVCVGGGWGGGGRGGGGGGVWEIGERACGLRGVAGGRVCVNQLIRLQEVGTQL